MAEANPQEHDIIQDRQSLQDRIILLVEDEYMLADDVRQELEGSGATVLGPVPDVAGAMELLAANEEIDGAVLDVNLGGSPSFPIADALIGRDIPFVFSTGYDSHALPERYQLILRCEKPAPTGLISATLSRLMRE